MLLSMEEKRVDHKPIYNVAKTSVESQTVLCKTVTGNALIQFVVFCANGSTESLERMDSHDD